MCGMRLKAVGLTLLLATLVAPAAGAQDNSGVPLVRMRDGHGSDLLFRVDPMTLKPNARPIRTFRSGAGLAFSPDGTRIAYTGGWRAGSTIHIIDLARWRSLGKARLGRHGSLGVGWVSNERVLAIAGEGFGRQRLVWVDVASKRVLARRSFEGRLVETLAVPGGFALALAPERGIGPLRILIATPDGGLRRIAVEGIPAGGNDGGARPRFLKPGLVADRDGGRLFVVAARELLVAEIDLASGSVSHHALGAAASKGNVDVWFRYATWAGDGRIAVTGEHHPAAGGRRLAPPTEAFGLRMIDTRDWSIDTFAPRPTSIYVSEDRVLAHGTRWFGARRPPKHTGLLAFDHAGRRAFTRFRGEDVALLGSRGDVGYVWVRRTRRVHVIDMGDGHTLREVQTGRRVPFLLSPRQ
jgi:hypothetical protein